MKGTNIKFKNVTDNRSHLLYFKHEDATSDKLTLWLSTHPDYVDICYRATINQSDVMYYSVEIIPISKWEVHLVIERRCTTPDAYTKHIATIDLRFGMIASSKSNKIIDKNESIRSVIRVFIPEEYDSAVKCIGGELIEEDY